MYLKNIFVCFNFRGVGMFIGIDLVKDRITKEPATEEAAYIIAR